MNRDPSDDGEVDVDAAWAEIVANWDRPAAPSEADVLEALEPETDDREDPPESGRLAGGLSWDELRVQDDVQDEPEESSETRPAEGPGTGPRDVAADGPSLIDGLEGADEDDEYVLPDPPRLPRPDLISALAGLGALGAPVLLLAAALFWRTAPALVIGGAVLAFVAGFVTLIVRMPDRNEDDDGAVV